MRPYSDYVVFLIREICDVEKQRLLHGCIKKQIFRGITLIVITLSRCCYKMQFTTFISRLRATKAYNKRRKYISIGACYTIIRAFMLAISTITLRPTVGRYVRIHLKISQRRNCVSYLSNHLIRI